MHQVFSTVKSVYGRVSSLGLALALSLAVPTLALAQDPVTLPDTGTNMSGLMQATITALGSLVAIAVGAMFAFWIIRRALRWFRGV